MPEESPTTFAAKLISEGHSPDEVKAIMEQRNMSYPSVSDVLNEFMTSKNFSPDELAERSGINSASIRKIMNKQRNPSRNMLIRIAMSLSLSLEETQVFLKSGNCTSLSASRERDLIIMDAIINGKNYDSVNDTLESKDMAVLKESFKYYAFISYSHKDKDVAQRLQKWLEHYHLPSKVLDDYPDVPQTLSPVFIDESDLVARGGGLVDSLKGYLNESKYLILICSPSSAQSKYVNEEVNYFIKELNRPDHIIPLIVEGIPNSKDIATECFPPAILELPYEQEPLGIDINLHQEHGAFLRVAATLLKLNIDYFMSREEDEKKREEEEKRRDEEARKKKRKRNIIAFLLIAAALVFIAAVLFSPAHAETEPENRLLYDLFGYIHQCEIIYSDILWITDAFDRFDRARSWESLQLARATVMIAEKDIERCKLPDLELTDNDRNILIKRGIDLTDFGNLKQMFEAEKTTTKNICQNLHASIMNDIYLKDNWQITMRKTVNNKRNMNLELQYLANMADWVLAKLNDPALTKKFNNLMKKHCQKTHAYQRKKLESIEKFEASTNAILNQYEDVLKEDTDIVEASTKVLNLVKRAIETQDLSLIKKNLMTISNMPPIIHCPSWLNNNDVYYFWRKNGKVQPTPKARTKLERIPDICRIKVNGVSLAQVKEYQKELKDMGLPCKESSERSGKLNLRYRAGGSEFFIVWENGKAEFLMTEKPFCLMPILYLLATKK